jgi:hypothetical protein
VRKLIALNMLREMPISGSACRLYKSVNELRDFD